MSFICFDCPSSRTNNHNGSKNIIKPYIGYQKQYKMRHICINRRGDNSENPPIVKFFENRHNIIDTICQFGKYYQTKFYKL